MNNQTSTPPSTPFDPPEGTPRPSDSRPTGHVKVGGIDFPLPPAAVYALTVLLVVGASAFIYENYLAEVVQGVRVSNEQERQDREFRHHFSEKPVSKETVFKDERGGLWVEYYKSDGCLLVRRNDRVQWIPNPGSSAPPEESDPNVVAVSSAGLSAGSDACPRQGKCLDKHAGEFESWNGEKKGCWVKVWRRWPDGCKQYQWYNSCDGNWNSKKNWVCCLH